MNMFKSAMPAAKSGSNKGDIVLSMLVIGAVLFGSIAACKWTLNWNSGAEVTPTVATAEPAQTERSTIVETVKTVAKVAGDDKPAHKFNLLQKIAAVIDIDPPSKLGWWFARLQFLEEEKSCVFNAKTEQFTRCDKLSTDWMTYLGGRHYVAVNNRNEESESDQ